MAKRKKSTKTSSRRKKKESAAASRPYKSTRRSRSIGPDGRSIYASVRNAALSAPMSRQKFIKTVGLAATGAVAMSSTSNAIGGDEPWENRLYPTGDAATDAKAMQDAVNRGGTVRLMSGRGTEFNLFGHTVTIVRDVSIISQGTKINFGQVPAFSCELAVKLSLRNFMLVDRSRVGVMPLDMISPQSGEIKLDVSNVAIGGDEPWE